jgi:acetate kinase
MSPSHAPTDQRAASDSAAVLTINGGSSSIKFALFESLEPPRRRWHGNIERIGSEGTALHATGEDGAEERQPIDAADHQQAADQLAGWLERHGALDRLEAIGHRVVHGGDKLVAPCWIDDGVLAELKRICPFDPEHLPGEIALIEAFGRRLPDVRQAACFDTSFHRDMPRVARLLPLPRHYEAQGIQRYGFHGLSYAYLMQELGHLEPRLAQEGRLVLAHLGNGASLAAVLDGQATETTMSFTPTAGLVMSTRSGNLDPGLVRYFLVNEKMSADEFHDMVNHRAGLLGVSETSSDMRDLLARRASDRRAAEAVELFCYQAKKFIGALAAAIGGLDLLVFAGGIGENAPPIRAEICAGLEFLGVQIDAERNAATAPVISADGSRARVRVIHTDEEIVIAKSVRSLA